MQRRPGGYLYRLFGKGSHLGVVAERSRHKAFSQRASGSYVDTRGLIVASFAITHEPRTMEPGGLVKQIWYTVVAAAFFVLLLGAAAGAMQVVLILLRRDERLSAAIAIIIAVPVLIGLVRGIGSSLRALNSERKEAMWARQQLEQHPQVDMCPHKRYNRMADLVMDVYIPENLKNKKRVETISRQCLDCGKTTYVREVLRSFDGGESWQISK